jgi:hypothetical protein
MVRPERLLRGLRPLALAYTRVALRAIAAAAARRRRRTPGLLVRSRNDDFIGS